MQYLTKKKNTYTISALKERCLKDRSTILVTKE